MWAVLTFVHVYLFCFVVVLWSLSRSCLLEDTDTLTQILSYHVVGGAVRSSDLTDGQTVDTLAENADVNVTIVENSDNSTTFRVNQAQVVSPDVMAFNGVIHVIDQVLVPAGFDAAAFLAECQETSSPSASPVPAATLNIAETAMLNEDLETLVTAINAADLLDELSGDELLTVFAPTDGGFEALPEGLL
mmetsp:Transcript_14123/g.30775  ORF Transcript_14123/g.30775 Transcript_14123/m.30775 type:complete len:190 (-) Transcript_14123:610-1179(-)